MGLLDAGFNDRALLGDPLTNIGIGLLQRSGPTRFPTSFGQNLGFGLGQASDAAARHEDIKAARERLKMASARNALEMRRLQQQADVEKRQVEAAARFEAPLEALKAQGLLTPQMGLFAAGLGDPLTMNTALASMRPLLDPAPSTAMRTAPIDADKLIEMGFNPSNVQAAVQSNDLSLLGSKKVTPASGTPFDLTGANVVALLKAGFDPNEIKAFSESGDPSVFQTPPQDSDSGAVDSSGQPVDEVSRGLGRLEELAFGGDNVEGIFTGRKAGIFNRAQDAVKTAIAIQGQTNPRISEYQALKQGMLGLIGRRMGEKGNTSNSDIMRIASLFPVVGGDVMPFLNEPLRGDTEEVARNKMANVRRVMGDIERANSLTDIESAISRGEKSRSNLGGPGASVDFANISDEALVNAIDNPATSPEQREIILSELDRRAAEK